MSLTLSMTYWGLDSNVFLNIRMNFSTYLSMHSDKSPNDLLFSLFHSVIPHFTFGIHYFFTFMNFSSSTTIKFFTFLLFVTSTAASSALFYLSKFTQSPISVKILMVPSMKWQQCIQLHLVELSLHNSNSVITCPSADISDFQKSLFDLPFFWGRGGEKASLSENLPFY